MKVTIDRSGCIGCGVCAGICPNVFEMDDEGLAAVHAQPKNEEERIGAGQAVQDCPVAVIHTEE